MATPAQARTASARPGSTAVGALLGLALATMAGCGPRAGDPARAAELAGARIDAFSDFDRWARRAAAADSAFRNPVSFEETVFAPLRRDPEVCGAWVERKGSDPRTVALPRTLARPADVHWVRLRDERVRDLRSGTATLPGAPRTPDRSCVLLSREDGGPDGVPIVVTVAYVIARPAAPP